MTIKRIAAVVVMMMTLTAYTHASHYSHPDKNISFTEMNSIDCLYILSDLYEDASAYICNYDDLVEALGEDTEDLKEAMTYLNKYGRYIESEGAMFKCKDDEYVVFIFCD